MWRKGHPTFPVSAFRGRKSVVERWPRLQYLKSDRHRMIRALTSTLPSLRNKLYFYDPSAIINLRNLTNLRPYPELKVRAVLHDGSTPALFCRPCHECLAEACSSALQIMRYTAGGQEHSSTYAEMGRVLRCIPLFYLPRSIVDSPMNTSRGMMRWHVSPLIGHRAAGIPFHAKL